MFTVIGYYAGMQVFCGEVADKSELSEYLNLQKNRLENGEFSFTCGRMTHIASVVCVDVYNGKKSSDNYMPMLATSFGK